jgi:hypothetical protein
MHVRVAITIFLAAAFDTSSLFAQEDRAFAHLPGMVMLDHSVPDFVAMTKSEGIFSNKEKEFDYLSRAKKDSLEIRKKQIQKMQDTLAHRIGQVVAERMRLQLNLEENELKAQSRPSVYAASMASAEQLLISAQLELQKVSWDLATEQELLENVEKTEVNLKTAGNEIERETLMIELQNLQTDLQFAEKEFAQVQELEKKGAIGQIDSAKAKQSVTKAKNALRMSDLRLREQEMKQEAFAKAKSAEIASQVRKLTARKTQIEKYIQELFASMNDLNQRQTIVAKIGRVEKELAANEKLQGEWMTKKEEIEGLLSILDTAELTVEKVKE